MTPPKNPISSQEQFAQALGGLIAFPLEWVWQADRVNRGYLAAGKKILSGLEAVTGTNNDDMFYLLKADRVMSGSPESPAAFLATVDSYLRRFSDEHPSPEKPGDTKDRLTTAVTAMATVMEACDGDAEKFRQILGLKSLFKKIESPKKLEFRTTEEPEMEFRIFFMDRGPYDSIGQLLVAGNLSAEAFAELVDYAVVRAGGRTKSADSALPVPSPVPG